MCDTLQLLFFYFAMVKFDLAKHKAFCRPLRRIYLRGVVSLFKFDDVENSNVWGLEAGPFKTAFILAVRPSENWF